MLARRDMDGVDGGYGTPCNRAMIPLPSVEQQALQPNLSPASQGEQAEGVWRGTGPPLRARYVCLFSPPQ